MFIEKVLEENLKENLEELYKLFMEFPENLSAFEKLIESFSKDLSIGFDCNSAFRAEVRAATVKTTIPNKNLTIHRILHTTIRKFFINKKEYTILFQIVIYFTMGTAQGSL